MTQLTLTLPLTVSNEEAQFFLAVKLFEVGKLSIGQSAKLAGYSKGTFIELISKMGIPVVNYSALELEEEIAE